MTKQHKHTTKSHALQPQSHAPWPRVAVASEPYGGPIAHLLEVLNFREVCGHITPHLCSTTGAAGKSISYKSGVCCAATVMAQCVGVHSARKMNPTTKQGSVGACVTTHSATQSTIHRPYLEGVEQLGGREVPNLQHTYTHTLVKNNPNVQQQHTGRNNQQHSSAPHTGTCPHPASGVLCPCQ